MQYLFPKDFLWGVSTSAYQIEGAVKEDGRGTTIWDTFSYTKGKVLNGDTGDVACDHYHRYKEDIRLMKELGLQVYHFSSAWTRILPDGKGKVNQAGIDFYSRLVDEVLEQGMQAWLTLYHWELPQVLHDEGGWTSRDTGDYFVEYANIMYKALGDRVSYWLTHNEPWVISYLGYGEGIHAPGIQDWKQAIQVSHNLLVSHGKAVEAFRSYNYPSKIGLNPNLYPVYTETDSPEDKEAGKRYFEYQNTWFLQALLQGSYPDRLWNYYEERGLAPQVGQDDMQTIQQKIDFLGVNYYSRIRVRYKQGQWLDAEMALEPGSPRTDMDWEIFPQGLYEILKHIHTTYPSIDLYITENGAACKDFISSDGAVHDNDRIDFLREHFKNGWKAIQEGVALKGHLVWSFLDNFEWSYGYSKRFGMVYVDYKTQKRTLKDSAFFFQKVIENNGL